MDKITGHTGFIALLGSPVSHSISPLMHNEAFRLLGLDYVYLCFDVTEDRLETAVSGLVTCGIRGFNLTMPNKTRIVEMLDELSPAARLIGAVNTVVCENGRLIGHNTDGTGFMRSVTDAGLDIRGKSIVILGNGGAATAIIAQAALDEAAKIQVFARPQSRFRERTEALIERINHSCSCRASLHDLADRSALAEALEESVLLVNATSVGMAPDVDRSPLSDHSLLQPELTVADVIYNPRETLFLRKAREAGCRSFNGMYMLLYQGAEAFRLWTGQDMPVEEIRAKYFS